MKVNMVLALLVGAGTINTSADTLKDVVSSVLDTNPIVNERLRNYNATKAEIGIAEAGYYPTINFESAAGRKTTGRIESDIANQTYNVFQNSLILKQNIFSGFSTTEKVDYRQMSALAAAYNYLEKANDVALQAVNVYTNLQKEKALLDNSELNVRHNELTYEKVQKAYNAGILTLSEVSKIHASLSLAKSNMMLQKNRLENAHNNFRRVVGRPTSLKVLTKVNSNLKLPANRKQAEKYALEYNPSILVGKYNVKGAEALYRESKSAFYPKVDFVLSQNYNENYNEFIGTDDRSQGLVVASYNLYNGGADEANKLNRMSKLNQEVAVVDDLNRQVIENINFSWNSYELSLDQIPFLEEYKSQSQMTLKLYVREYKLGKRSMLDLISAENDFKRANDELISAQYNLLLSKYRIMHDMGLTMVSIMGSEKEYYQRVGIKAKSKYVDNDPYNELYHAMKVDRSQQSKQYSNSLPVTQDKDKISEHKDISQNTQKTVEPAPRQTSTFINELKKVRWESR